MGRPRKPEELHIANGTYRTARHKDTLKAFGELVKPDNLTEHQSATWDLIVNSFPGNLAAVDEIELRQYCHLVERLDILRQQETADPTNLAITRSVLSVGVEIRRMGTGFGMNPSARQGMKKPDVTYVDELSEFLVDPNVKVDPLLKYMQ